MTMQWIEDGRGVLVLEARMAVPGAAAPDDANLVERSRAGDRGAFTGLYRRFRPMVHGVLLASVPALEIGDLVQDVFTRAWTSLPTLRDSTAFGPWLAAIARRRAVDFHRAPQPVVLPEPANEPPRFAEGLALLQAIRSLPEVHRETLVLRLVEGMTGPEISARTGKSHAAVRASLHRGMKQLRERLTQEDTTR